MVTLPDVSPVAVIAVRPNGKLGDGTRTLVLGMLPVEVAITVANVTPGRLIATCSLAWNPPPLTLVP